MIFFRYSYLEYAVRRLNCDSLNPLYKLCKLFVYKLIILSKNQHMTLVRIVSMMRWITMAKGTDIHRIILRTALWVVSFCCLLIWYKTNTLLKLRSSTFNDWVWFDSLYRADRRKIITLKYNILAQLIRKLLIIWRDV